MLSLLVFTDRSSGCWLLISWYIGSGNGAQMAMAPTFIGQCLKEKIEIL